MAQVTVPPLVCMAVCPSTHDTYRILLRDAPRVDTNAGGVEATRWKQEHACRHNGDETRDARGAATALSLESYVYYICLCQAPRKMQNMLDRRKKEGSSLGTNVGCSNYSTRSFLFPLLCGHKRPCFASFSVWQRLPSSLYDRQYSRFFLCMMLTCI